MKTAIYPGSFNPWHKGHEDILNKALKLFDKVIVAQGINPEKNQELKLPIINNKKVKVLQFNGLLSETIKMYNINCIVKGLRNSQDFEYEKIQQYWNEDLKIKIPVIYLISDRKLVHISSSAIKMVNKFKGKKK